MELLDLLGHLTESEYIDVIYDADISDRVTLWRTI